MVQGRRRSTACMARVWRCWRAISSLHSRRGSWQTWITWRCVCVCNVCVCQCKWLGCCWYVLLCTAAGAAAAIPPQAAGSPDLPVRLCVPACLCLRRSSSSSLKSSPTLQMARSARQPACLIPPSTSRGTWTRVSGRQPRSSQPPAGPQPSFLTVTWKVGAV